LFPSDAVSLSYACIKEGRPELFFWKAETSLLKRFIIAGIDYLPRA
jgi:hypothetical protein